MTVRVYYNNKEKDFIVFVAPYELIFKMYIIYFIYNILYIIAFVSDTYIFRLKL